MKQQNECLWKVELQLRIVALLMVDCPFINLVLLVQNP